MKDITIILTGVLSMMAAVAPQAQADCNSDYWAPENMAARQCTSVHLGYLPGLPEHTAAYQEMVVERSALNAYLQDQTYSNVWQEYLIPSFLNVIRVSQTNAIVSMNNNECIDIKKHEQIAVIPEPYEWDLIHFHLISNEEGEFLLSEERYIEVKLEYGDFFFLVNGHRYNSVDEIIASHDINHYKLLYSSVLMSYENARKVVNLLRSKGVPISSFMKVNNRAGYHFFTISERIR